MHRSFLVVCALLAIACSGFSRSDDPETGYPYGIPFESVEVPVYQFASLTPQAHLRMDYASAVIRNPDAWWKVRERGEVYAIDLVFTKFPLDSTKWHTSFNRLLKNRLRSLFSIDDRLNDKRIQWRLVLQTKCESEHRARQFFHGFVIKYKVTRPQVLRHVNDVWDLENLLSGKAVTWDSTVLNIMERNRGWDSALVVMDWTGSMYPYSAQVVLWHKLNLRTSGIRHFVLFNDGNRKLTREKHIGRTGGIYYTPCGDMEDIIETISTVMYNGYGGDTPENDIEAVMRGLRNVEDFKEVVLIADNESMVRDLKLLRNIDKPVRVVLCGSESGRINPDYIQIAFQTKGSLHTVEEDILTMANLKEGDMIEIEGYRYKVRGGRLEPFR